MDLKETDILGKDIANHWYYRSKASAMRKFLRKLAPSSVLDVGAGSAFFSRDLLRFPNVSEAWCIDTSYAEESDDSENGKAIHFRRALQVTDAKLILLMDVLEHVDDDIGLLTEYVRKVPAGAYFLISVPAFQFLWSSHDEFLEHKRRYTLSQIENVVKQSGLVIERSAYYFGLVLPIVMIVRLSERLLQDKKRQGRSQLSKHNRLINSVLTVLCRAELPIIFLNKFAGLTAFCLARKI